MRQPLSFGVIILAALSLGIAGCSKKDDSQTHNVSDKDFQKLQNLSKEEKASQQKQEEALRSLEVARSQMTQSQEALLIAQQEAEEAAEKLSKAEKEKQAAEAAEKTASANNSEADQKLSKAEEKRQAAERDRQAAEAAEKAAQEKARLAQEERARVEAEKLALEQEAERLKAEIAERERQAQLKIAAKVAQEKARLAAEAAKKAAEADALAELALQTRTGQTPEMKAFLESDEARYVFIAFYGESSKDRLTSVRQELSRIIRQVSGQGSSLLQSMGPTPDALVNIPSSVSQYRVQSLSVSDQYVALVRGNDLPGLHKMVTEKDLMGRPSQLHMVFTLFDQIAYDNYIIAEFAEPKKEGTLFSVDVPLVGKQSIGGKDVRESNPIRLSAASELIIEKLSEEPQFAVDGVRKHYNLAFGQSDLCEDLTEDCFDHIASRAFTNRLGRTQLLGLLNDSLDAFDAFFSGLPADPLKKSEHSKDQSVEEADPSKMIRNLRIESDLYVPVYISDQRLVNELDSKWGRPKKDNKGLREDLAPGSGRFFLRGTGNMHFYRLPYSSEIDMGYVLNARKPSQKMSSLLEEFVTILEK